MSACFVGGKVRCPVLAIVALLVLVLLGFLGAITDPAPLTPVLLLAHPFERPPRATSL